MLSAMLDEFNEGRSKSFYCIAATVMETKEITEAISRAGAVCAGADVRTRSKALHAILNEIAEKRNYTLRLRK